MNEDNFRKYLKTIVNQRGNNFNIDKINEFIKDIKEKIPNEIGDNNLFDVSDIEKIKAIKEKLNDINNPLHEFNKQERKGRPSNALYQYINFLEEIKKKNSLNITKGNLNFPHKNLLLKGVPGTGKSRTIEKIIENKLDMNSIRDNVLRINIHSASSNSDLMQGISISTDDKSNILYKEKRGAVLNHIFKAMFKPNQPFVLILEEIQENSLLEI